MSKTYPEFVPMGHFYSPHPDLEYLKSNEQGVFNVNPGDIPGIDLNLNKQIKIFHEFVSFYKEMPFKEEQTSDLRYYFENPAFSYSDALSLYGMIRKFRPDRIIEVGSGFSSCVTLDTNDLFFDSKINCEFIEPYPDLLNSLTQNDSIILKECKIQDVKKSYFASLKANDILFIDSTHVSKAGSDVNYIFFEILPILQKGVVVHFHDIFCNFEYPKAWVYEGRAWNEDYLLRAFLQFNNAFEILFFNNYIVAKEKKLFEEHMPLYLKNPGGSLWMIKV